MKNTKMRDKAMTVQVSDREAEQHVRPRLRKTIHASVIEALRKCNGSPPKRWQAQTLAGRSGPEQVSFRGRAVHVPHVTLKLWAVSTDWYKYTISISGYRETLYFTLKHLASQHGRKFSTETHPSTDLSSFSYERRRTERLANHPAIL